MKENQRKEILRLTNLSGCYCLFILFIHDRFFPLLILIIYSSKAYTQKKACLVLVSLRLQLISLSFGKHK